MTLNPTLLARFENDSIVYERMWVGSTCAPCHGVGASAMRMPPLRRILYNSSMAFVSSYTCSRTWDASIPSKETSRYGKFLMSPVTTTSYFLAIRILVSSESTPKTLIVLSGLCAPSHPAPHPTSNIFLQLCLRKVCHISLTRGFDGSPFIVIFLMTTPPIVINGYDHISEMAQEYGHASCSSSHFQ